jgi:hypothetical protein
MSKSIHQKIPYSKDAANTIPKTASTQGDTLGGDALGGVSDVFDVSAQFAASLDDRPHAQPGSLPKDGKHVEPNIAERGGG